MSDPLTDKYGNRICPMPVASTSIDDDDNEHLILLPCRASLYLDVRMAFSATNASTWEQWSSRNAGDSSWSVKCEDGHVIAVSTNVESAEAYDPAVLPPAVQG